MGMAASVDTPSPAGYGTLVVPRRPPSAGAALLDGLVDGREQRLVVERLAQVVDGTRQPRALARRRVVARSDEQHGNAMSGRDETLVHVEPAQTAEMHVEHETGDVAGPGR